MWGDRAKGHLNGLGVIAGSPVLGIGFGPAGVTGGCPNNAVQATEHGLRPPEASKGEECGPEGRVRRFLRRFGNPIQKPYAVSSMEKRSHQEDDPEK